MFFHACRGRMGRFFAATAAVALLFPATINRAVAQEDESRVIPGAPHLLPEGTYAYVRLDNADELRAGLSESSVGRMLNDPKLKPFATDLYVTLRDLFEQISDEVGVSLDELLSIPSGQVAAAFIPGKMSEEENKSQAEDAEDESPEAIRRRLNRQRRRENGFAGVFIVDAGDNVDKLQMIVDRLEWRVIEDGYVRRNKTVQKTEVVRLLPPRQGPPEIEYFERDDVIVFGIGHRTAQDVLDRWLDESEEPTLADSANFANVMVRCAVGAESTRPQMTFFVDPYHIAERVVMRSGSLTVGMFWPMIQDLGLARIRGLGASAFKGGEVFEDISHMHILIDPPRDGLLAVLRPETGDSTPPDWVPSDITGYTSLHWDLDNTYENVGKILDKFQGEDSLKRFAEEPLKKRLDVDLRADIIGNLTGRLVRCIWMEPPARLNSQSQINALQLSDPVTAKSVIAKYRDRRPNDLTVETIGGQVVYFGKNRRQNFPENLRRPEPGFVVLGDWLITSDSRKFLERAMRTKNGNLSRLVDLPEYNLVSSELGGKLDGEQPFLVSYMDSAEIFRQLYDLAKADNSRQFLRRAGEKNVVARKMADLIQRHQLPPYEEFEKYFAPSGTFAYDEPTGIHLGSFTLKADE